MTSKFATRNFLSEAGYINDLCMAMKLTCAGPRQAVPQEEALLSIGMCLLSQLKPAG